MKLEEALQRYFRYLRNIRNASPYTLRNYQKAFCALQQFLPEKAHLSDITPEVIDELQDWLYQKKNPRGEPLSARTRNLYLIPIRSFLAFCIKRDFEDNILNPEKIELSRPPQSDVSGLSPEELQRLRTLMPHKDHLRNLRDRAIVEMLFSTGLRISELVALNRDQVNLTQKEFSVRGKGGRYRTVYLTERCVKVLEAYLSARKDAFPPLFINLRKQKDEIATHGESRRLSRTYIEIMLRERGRLCGITRPVTPHKLRHTFATTLLRNGADLRSVQELLGHANISTTQIYTKVANAQLKEVHKKYLE